MAQGQASEDLENLYIEIRRRLIESGQWDRFRTILYTRLSESGWLDEMNDKAEGQAQVMEAPTVEAIFEELKSDAHGSLPLAVKDEISAVIGGQIGKILA